jgi:hypothetical protein
MLLVGVNLGTGFPRCGIPPELFIRFQLYLPTLGKRRFNEFGKDRSRLVVRDRSGSLRGWKEMKMVHLFPRLEKTLINNVLSLTIRKSLKRCVDKIRGSLDKI